MFHYVLFLLISARFWDNWDVWAQKLSNWLFIWKIRLLFSENNGVFVYYFADIGIMSAIVTRNLANFIICPHVTFAIIFSCVATLCRIHTKFSVVWPRYAGFTTKFWYSFASIISVIARRHACWRSTWRSLGTRRQK